MKYLPEPAGSLTIHNCRTLHYSAKNDLDLGRPLLLNAMRPKSRGDRLVA